MAATSPGIPVDDRAAADAQPCPADFAYARGSARPTLRWLRGLARGLLGADLCPPDDAIARILADLHAGDPVAERFVDAVLRGPDGARAGREIMNRALAEGISAVSEAPEAMRALFAEFEEVPAWVDRALVEEGAAIWRRWGTTLFAVAGATTLEIYTESAVALPLSLTGGYAGDKALHRFLETVRFWIDVSQPGALFRIGSAGRSTAMRVRVMHVSVRRRVASHPEWDARRWGLPISQTYMVLTLMGGSIGPALAMWALGQPTTPHEIRALLHFQRYLGHLLGVRPRWYPETVREGIQMLAVPMLARTYTAGEHGAELIESFPRAFEPRPGLRGIARIEAILDHRLMEGYSLLFTSRRARRGLAMPPLRRLAHPLVRIPFTWAREVVRRVVPGFDRLIERRACAERERWFRARMEGREARFEAGAPLRR